MNADGHHARNQPCLRAVPFYSFSEQVHADEKLVLDQGAIAPTILNLIGIDTPESMIVPALVK